MWFFTRNQPTKASSLQDSKFSILWRQSSFMGTLLQLVRWYGVTGSLVSFHILFAVVEQSDWERDYLITYVPALKFQKSLIYIVLCRPKIHHFFFYQTWGPRFRYLPMGCTYMLMYSASHIMQWFFKTVDVFTPKIRRKFFDFDISMNQNKHRLHKT